MKLVVDFLDIAVACSTCGRLSQGRHGYGFDGFGRTHQFLKMGS